MKGLDFYDKTLWLKNLEIKDEDLLQEYLDFLSINKVNKGHLEGTENHHIFPKSLCKIIGKESWVYNKHNFVILTYKDHYIAHTYLYKFLSGEAAKKMSYAFVSMLPKNYMTEYEEGYEAYEKMRKEIVSKFSGENSPFYGKPRSAETKRKISEAEKGKKISKETIEKMIKTNTGRYRYTNGEISKIIDPCEVPYYESIGWYRGVSKSHIENNRKAHIGLNSNTPEAIEKTRAKLRLKRWYTNGQQSKMLNDEEAVEYILEGWTRGRVYNKKGS